MIVVLITAGDSNKPFLFDIQKSINKTVDIIHQTSCHHILSNKLKPNLIAKSYLYIKKTIIYINIYTFIFTKKISTLFNLKVKRTNLVDFIFPFQLFLYWFNTWR